MMKRETGAITLYVTIVCLFIIIVAIAGYIQISNKQAAQIGQLKEIERSYESQITLEDVYKGYAGGEIIHINTEEELLKIGSNEDVYINGKIYTFGSNCTYELEKDFEITGSFREVAQKIKDGQILINGNNHTIKAVNEKGIEEYYTKYSKYYIATNKYGYVLDGLELYYDGIDNTGTGEHSLTTTTWKDLSENNRDGRLVDFGTSAISGWGKNNLSFDGINDWVNCGELNNDYATIDMCYLIKEESTKWKALCGNWENGGNGIYIKNNNLTTVTHIGGEYKYVELENKIEKNNITTSTYSYDGKNQKIYKNGLESLNNLQTGKIELPQSNTVMAIGGNPFGTNDINYELSYIDVYSVRIYNRGLTEEEVKINNEADERRYKQETIIPIYTQEQVLKMGSGENIFVEQENKTYNYAKGAIYEYKNDIEINSDYSQIASKINNKEIFIKQNESKIKNGEKYYTSKSKYTIPVNKYGYVLDGLELYYDGIDNTGTGEHSLDVATWKDLSGNNRDGSLKNITLSSAWKSGGLTFDGVDDYVLIQEMNYDNVTLEIVMQSEKENNSNLEIIFGNVDNGGYAIYYSSRVAFEAYINEKNSYIQPEYKGYRPMAISQGIRYSVSGYYNGKRMFARIDGQYQYADVTGTIKPPLKNTAVILGANPIGTIAQSEYFLGTIYTARVYSKALSDEEMSVNYLNDIDRYNL